MNKAILAAVDNQLNSSSYIARYYAAKFKKLSADAGLGAIMMTIIANPNCTRKRIIDILHEKYNTTGAYTVQFVQLTNAKLIENDRKQGVRLTQLAYDLLRAHNLI
jgi:hypothetical protein